MSNLADLLNPAPSNGAGAQSKSTAPAQTSTSPHKRNESITSPLEALAIAASTSAPATQSRPAIASPSFPPNPYLNTNPYAIKPQQHSPAAARPPSRPNASSHSPSAPGSSPPPAAKQSVKYPPPASEPTRQDTTQTSIKTEPTEEPHALSAAATTTDASTIKRESETPSRAPQEDVEMKMDAPPEPKAPKEPKRTVAATKKGTAKAKKDTGDSSVAPKRPKAKKRKLEAESKDGTPFSQRSGTPNSRASKTPAPKRTPQQSPAPPAALASEDEGYEDASEDASDDNDGELFCICRKPDDHTWMIACDGGCDDWFHGKCVRMNEADGNLIDKYICPNCEKAGRGRTMWKPMCRLPGCRDPARVAGKKPSKYCCDDHGRQFMRERAAGKLSKDSKADDGRKRRKAAKDLAAHEEEVAAALNGDDDGSGHQAHLRGGILKPGELKALVGTVKTAEQFKKLGDKASLAEITNGTRKTPAVEANGDVKMEVDGGGNGGDDNDTELAAPALNFTEQEQAALGVASKRRAALNAELNLLADRDKLLTMVKARHKSVLEEMRKKDKAVKDICGYDSRLIWSDAEFDAWRAGDEGRAALAAGSMPPPPKHRPEDTNGAGNAFTTAAAAAANDSADSAADEVGRGVCKRKRCERHKTWAKLCQQEINLARSQCWHQMRKIDREEEELRERALIRQREAR